MQVWKVQRQRWLRDAQRMFFQRLLTSLNVMHRGSRTSGTAMLPRPLRRTPSTHEPILSGLQILLQLLVFGLLTCVFLLPLNSLRLRALAITDIAVSV